jgi:hypothetical protein
MKGFLSKITLLRLFCLFSGLFTLWLIFSPVENHSLFHWEIIFALSLITIGLLVIEHYLKKRITDKSKLSLVELLILVSLIAGWRYLVA